MLPKHMLEKLEQLGVKPYFYYDYSRQLATSICLLRDGATFIARGIAFCSLKDDFNKRIGRTIACGRAIKAFVRRENSLPAALTLHGEGEIYKSRYRPLLNWKEQELLDSIRENEKRSS